MIEVADIYDDAKKIVGTCDDPTLFRRISEAVEVLANKGDFDPLLGEMDICADDTCVTLPREVEMVMAVNLNGHPTIGRDRWFNYHINGPGMRSRDQVHGWSWIDGAESPVFRELKAPSKLIAFVQRQEDAGQELRVFGWDSNNNWIRTQEDGKWVDGYRVPTIFGYAMPEADAPLFARIARVKKAVTVGTIRLTSLEISATTGTLIGQYDYDETDPLYRRIAMPRRARWVRIAFRRRVFKITSTAGVIPLHSTVAILEMMRALKAYGDDEVTLGQGHEATAERFITEEQASRNPPVNMPIQVNPYNQIVDPYDQLDNE